MNLSSFGSKGIKWYILHFLGLQKETLCQISISKQYTVSQSLNLIFNNTAMRKPYSASPMVSPKASWPLFCNFFFFWLFFVFVTCVVKKKVSIICCVRKKMIVAHTLALLIQMDETLRICKGLWRQCHNGQCFVHPHVSDKISKECVGVLWESCRKHAIQQCLKNLLQYCHNNVIVTVKCL